jgi:hypothetical protein
VAEVRPQLYEAAMFGAKIASTLICLDCFKIDPGDRSFARLKDAGRLLTAEDAFGSETWELPALCASAWAPLSEFRR